jgi:hypothetical protein
MDQDGALVDHIIDEKTWKKREGTIKNQHLIFTEYEKESLDDC